MQCGLIVFLWASSVVRSRVQIWVVQISSGRGEGLLLISDSASAENRHPYWWHQLEVAFCIFTAFHIPCKIENSPLAQ